ncbi:hypothetical protein RN001_001595 [Aquatica leii]|uniref:Regulator of G-protein signaling loco n=1 Tax=Aquatica leii TaxID=1421715 RepID=A0AAN7PG43_9COLE|nr:hypothetical protein RN001_001595 [Aquatica leii]
MHPSRRRKKRPNYGIRTVEVIRGPSGFGFTISGQQPCILSCIVSNSPADQAGLRAGDFLISVNGMSVSKSTHDSVVNLIGNSIGPIKMTIAENYYSDSSDEDMDLGRMINNRKPKYMHRPRTRHYKHEASSSANDRLGFNSPTKKVMRIQSEGNKNIENQDNVPVKGPSGLLPIDGEEDPVEYKALVGYLGTIEMPKQLVPSSRLQTVCSCIRKLRQEKRTPTTILMTILPSCLTLKNASNQILAIYPTSRVVYVSSSIDKDLRYFGLVTSATCDNRAIDNVRNGQYANANDSWVPKMFEKSNNVEERFEVEVSNSCHVFMTDPKIIDHKVHIEKAEHFKINCTPDMVMGNCLEFPKNACYIVSLVQSMYKLQDSTKSNGRNEDNLVPIMANSPQPSASSNSDSGIGFRDDCGNISDRILLVEFPAQQHLPIVPSLSSKRPVGIDASSLLLEKLDKSANNLNNNAVGYSVCSDLNNIRCKNIDYKCVKSINNFEDKENKPSNLNNVSAFYENHKISLEKSQNCTKTDIDYYKNRLTVRAMPDPKRSFQNYEETCRNGDIDTGQVFTERPVDVPIKKSFETASTNSFPEDASSIENVSVYSSKSLELDNMKAIFKTPSTKYLDKKSIKRKLKMVGSYDNLMTENYESSLLNYKLSPKVYGLSKPNHSCEELNSFDGIEKCGYGSLQDLCSLVGQSSTKCGIAQSEPDIRLQRRQQLNFLCEENGIQNSKQTEAVASWATAFEKLLTDPIGLQTFAEFLKKEFSAENIYFWTSCERYRRLPSGPEKVAEAQRIYKRHLCVGAPEAVNVDSQVRQFTEQSLLEANSSLFEQTQKQIFNLMKFDSYPRFLKSDLYKQSLAGQIETSIDDGLLLQPPGTTPGKLKKSLSNAEDRWRKSLLPWHRKNRSKSKDREEIEYNSKKDDCNENANDEVNKIEGNDVHSSKSSLTSQESSKGLQEDISINSAVARGPLCRVILTNGSTTVVKIKDNETVEQMVNHVLEKRGIAYSSFEVFTDKHSKAVNIGDSSLVLAGCEVKVEQRVIFKLDLPNRKVIAVKSKSTKILMDVLKPILNKYDYRLEQVKVLIGPANKVDIAQPVTTIDGMRLNIQINNDWKERCSIQSEKNLNVKVFNPSSLDEITNKVFKELLQEKGDCKFKSGSERGSIKSEDWGSDHSSGLLGRFLRRDSGIHDKKKHVARLKNPSNHSSIEDITNENCLITKKPLIAKWKTGVNKLHVGCSESEKLYEGLNRAQNSRIEDQRGTEINFELPDFLKDKEMGQHNCSRVRKLRRTENGNSENSRFYDTDVAIQQKQDKINSAINTTRNLKVEPQCNYENRNIIFGTEHNSVNNNLHNFNQNVELNNIRRYPVCTRTPDDSLKSLQSTPAKCNKLNNTVIENLSNTVVEGQDTPKIGDPPPLPPKPKILPIKPSNWGQGGLFKVPRAPRSDGTKPSLYLEHPTSSFV